MNKNKSNAQTPVGIHIEQVAVTQTGKTKRSAVPGIICEYLIILACTIGALLTFTTMLGIHAYIAMPLAVTAAAAALLMAVYKKLKRAWIVLLAAAAVGIVGFIAVFASTQGVQALYQDAYEVICVSMFWTVPPKSIDTADSSVVMSASLALSFVMLAVSAVVTYFTVRRANFFAVLLCTVFFAEIGLAYGCVPNHIAISLLISGWIGSLILHLSNRQSVRISGKVAKRRKTTRIANGSRAGRFTVTALSVSLAVFIIFNICNGVISGGAVERGQSIDTLRFDMSESLNNILDLVTGVDHDASLKEGQLYKLGDRIVKDRTYMRVRMPWSTETIYLRGYVGGSYTGTTFDKIAADDNNATMFSTAEEAGIPIAGMTGAALDSSESKAAIASGKFTISELRRKKNYMYLAYGAYLSGYTAIGDASAKPADKSLYAYDAYFDDDTQFLITKTPMYSNSTYKTISRLYSNYVNEHYLTVPGGMSDVQQIVASLGSPSGRYNAVDLIRNYLSQNTTYSDDSVKLPAGKDFVTYFLTEQKAGYSAHYAAAAAVMLRMMGVPTRYCEGFIATPAALDNSQNSGTGYKSIVLTDEASHAWIEIYDTTYGWIRVETTPGFYDQDKSFEDEMNEAQDKAEKTPVNEEETPKYDTDLDVEDKNDIEDPNANVPVTDVDGDGDDGEGDAGYIFGSEAADRAVSISGIILLLLVALIVAVIVRRAVANKRRNALMHSDDTNTRVFAYFDHLMKMIRYDGVEDAKFTSYAKFERILREKATYVPLESLHSVISTALAAGFSDKPVSDEAADEMDTFIFDYQYDLYANLSLPKKLKYKFITNLK